MVTITDFLNWIGGFIPIVRTVIVVALFFVVFNLILKIIKKALLKKVKSKKQISNIEIFSRIFQYGVLFLLIIFAIFTYAESWTGLGLTVGLFSAALGWALQKPITGIAGWIMVVTKRPFEIGDRIIIGGVKGDVDDITLTHTYIREIGGTVAGEENSGRVILIPNSKLFEQDITNYTLEDEYVLDQVAVSITYESDLDKAIKIVIDAATQATKEFFNKVKKKPYVRVLFEHSGLSVRVRYFAPATKLQKIASEITKNIFNTISKAKGVEIAYPHTVVKFKDKGVFK